MAVIGDGKVRSRMTDASSWVGSFMASGFFGM